MSVVTDWVRAAVIDELWVFGNGEWLVWFGMARGCRRCGAWLVLGQGNLDGTGLVFLCARLGLVCLKLAYTCGIAKLGLLNLKLGNCFAPDVA